MTSFIVDSPHVMQVKYLYPYENDEGINKRIKKLEREKRSGEISFKVRNVVTYVSLGYVDYSLLDSKLQEIIRNNYNLPNSTYDCILDLLEILANKVNDKEALRLLDKELIKYLYDDPTEIENLKLEHVFLLKKLHLKFPSYICSKNIQMDLLMPSHRIQKDNQINHECSILKSRISDALSLDLSHCQFPARFFNNYFLDKAFGSNLKPNSTQCLSPVCIQFLYDILKIIGEKNLSIINDADIQDKIILVNKQNIEQHEATFLAKKPFVINLLNDIIELDICDLDKEYFMDQKIFRNLISEISFDYTKSFEYFNKIKARFPFYKLNKKSIWNLIKPTVISPHTIMEARDAFENLNLFFDFLDELSKKEDVKKYLNSDLVNCVIECNQMISLDHFNAVLKINKQLFAQEGILVERKLILGVFYVDDDKIKTNEEIDQLYKSAVKAIKSTEHLELESEVTLVKSQSNLLDTEKVHPEILMTPSYSESEALMHNEENGNATWLEFYEETSNNFAEKQVSFKNKNNQIKKPIDSTQVSVEYKNEQVTILLPKQNEQVAQKDEADGEEELAESIFNFNAVYFIACLGVILLILIGFTFYGYAILQ